MNNPNAVPICDIALTDEPEDVSQWHPKVTSLARFIDMQILVKSGGGIE